MSRMAPNGEETIFTQSYGPPFSLYSFDRRDKAKTGGGELIMLVGDWSRQGLGKTGMLIVGLSFISSLSGWPSSTSWDSGCDFTGVPIGPWSKFTMDNVGELAVSEARMLVAFSFNSGAKVEVLGGR